MEKNTPFTSRSNTIAIGGAAVHFFLIQVRDVSKVVVVVGMLSQPAVSARVVFLQALEHETTPTSKSSKQCGSTTNRPLPFDFGQTRITQH